MKCQDFLLMLSLMIAGTMTAQVYDQISVGQGYHQTAFYKLSDGNVTHSSLTAWDIAFSTDAQSGGAFINEGSSSTTSDPQPELKVYVTSSSEFDNVDTSGMERIFNNETSWSSGAFNSVADPENNLDYGWGVYSFNTHKVIGNTVFAVQLRDETFKKLMIDSLASGTYYFTYANLDGSNLQQKAVTKADFQDQPLAYFSFSENATVDVISDQWDLQFTRYTTPIDAGGGQVIQYMVTGTLSGTDIEVAQADNVDPAEVNYDDYKSKFSDTLTVIGHDWKTFDLDNFEWIIPEDRAYFVKTAENVVYKVVFVDFEGSSTGTITLQKEVVAETTSTVEGSENISELTLFPNPTREAVNFSVDVKSGSQNAYIRIHSITGEEVYNLPIQLHGGFNVKRMNLNFPAGMYYFNLQLKDEVISRKLQIQ